MKKILMLGSLFPETMEDYIISKYIKKDINISNVLFERKLKKGLEENGANVSVISTPSVGEFPKSCKKIRFKEKEIDSSFVFAKYCTVFPFIHFFKYRSLKKHIRKYIKENKNDFLHVIIPEMHYPYLKIVKYIKSKLKNVFITIMVPDLPQFSRRKTKNPLYALYKNYIVKESYILANKYSDSFVFLSERMTDFFDIKKRPYVVIPGIQDPYDMPIRKDNKKLFLYTGKITKENGVFVLLDAFLDFLKNNDYYDLVYIGDGPDYDDLLKKATLSSHIKVVGKKSHSEVMEFYKKSDYLVCPRIPVGEYINYSFPSKVLDCLATGKPTISFDLPCFSDDVRDILLIPQKNDSMSLSDLFKDVVQGHFNSEILKEKQLKYIEKHCPKSVAERIIFLSGDGQNEK